MRSKWPIPAVVLGTSGNALGVARALGRRGVRVIGVIRNGKKEFANSRYFSWVWKQDGDENGLVDYLLERGPDFTEKPP